VADVQPSDEVTDEPSDFGSLKSGTRLGRYELLVPIARGGMARVWAARQHGQRGFQKLVAIKTILPHLAEEPEFERMFLDEARIASGVHHPNVCEIYELGEERRTLYLAMEWVSGDSLARLLRASGGTEAIDVRVAARIVADACAGAHAAHELADEDGRPLAVVHRDLSPHNVLLTADGVAKVCDFGVAKALGQLHEQTSVGQLKGKVAYMSPEQVTGSELDRRSDVFSLGCLLYEATTGARPFAGERDHQIMHAIMQNAVKPPSQIVRQYPPALEHIVMRALSPKPILRFPTAERMRFALEEFLAKGHLVTHANVAQLVKARLGELLEKRRERIRQASNATEPLPSDRDPSPERSGVKPAQAVTSTLPLPPLDEATLHGHSAPSSATIAGAPAIDTTDALAEAPVVAPLSPPTPHMGMPAGVPLDDRAPDDAVPPPPSSPEPIVAPPPWTLYSPPSAPPSVPSELEGPDPEAPASHYVLAALVGVVLAVLIGGGGFYVWKRRTPVATAPTRSPVVTAPTTVTFFVHPEDATLFADGVPLPARVIPQPALGQTVAVVARARGYEDGAVMVDRSSVSPVVITLRPAPAPAAPAPEPDPSIAPSSSATSAPRPHVRPRPNPGSPLPDNPY